ncbi:dysbindin protein homolog [Argonauta hians]
MSVFEVIKDKFHTVQQDLSAGINLIKNQESLTPVKKVKPVDHVNYDAGADLLYKYQLLWKDIQKVNEENAKKAESLDREIQIIYGDIKKNCNNLTGFYREVKSLPSFLGVLQNLTDLLASLEESCDSVESALVRLENVSETQELKQHMQSHTDQLSNYRRRKEEELKRLAAQKNIRFTTEAESKTKQTQDVQRERSETFEEAFQNDLDYYRTHGYMNRLPNGEGSKNLDLSDITLEQDESDLAKFLASTEITPCSEKGHLGISFSSSNVAGDITSPSDVDLLTPMTPGSEWGAADESSTSSETDAGNQPSKSDNSQNVDPEADETVTDHSTGDEDANQQTNTNLSKIETFQNVDSVNSNKSM